MQKLSYYVPMSNVCIRRKAGAKHVLNQETRCGCSECLRAEGAHVSWNMETLRLWGGTAVRFYSPSAVVPGKPPEGDEERVRRHKWVGETTVVPFRLVP